MVAQFLILHLYRYWPQAKCQALQVQEEVHHVGAAGLIVKVHVEVFVEVVHAHAISIFVVIWSALIVFAVP